MNALLRRIHLATTLAVKLFVPIAALGLVLVAGIAVLSYQVLRHAITRQYEERARGAAVLMDHEIEEGHLGLLLRDPAHAASHIAALLRVYPEFYRVTIYARVGGEYRVAASSDPSRVGLPAEPHDLVPIDTGRLYLHEDIENGRRVLEVGAPLHEGSQAIAVLGAYATLADRDRALSALAGQITAITLLGLVAALGLMYMIVSTAVFQPLQRVRALAERVAAGDLPLEESDRDSEVSPGKVRDEISRFTRVFNRIVTEVRQDREQLHAMAITDPLTGLHNRRFFEEIIQRELAQADRYHEPFSVAVVDVNGLREVNNRLGHVAGDSLLQRTAQFLRRNVRSSDEVIRWGGDEFLILMPNTGATGAAHVEERMKAGLSSTGADGGAGVGFGIGVSTWEPGRELEDILREADARMYDDKRSSRSSPAGS